MTLRAAAIATVHAPVPLHPAPLHPEKLEPAVGVAVNVTDVPWLNVALHVGPQSMPVGSELTTPLPVPALVTVSACVFKLNVAVTIADWLTVIAHDPVPLHPPPFHPMKFDSALGVAVSVTLVPKLKV
jgi:hypothetical protein